MAVSLDPHDHRLMEIAFYQISGYTEYDLLSVNWEDRLFMTRNGGIYRVDDKFNVKWVKGPPVSPDDRF